MLEIKTPPIVRSFTGFQPLRETWLGDCYPIHYYDHFDNKSRDFFSYITEITKQDLNKIQKKIESFGITVRRPEFTNLENFLDQDNNLCKPPICPRDWALTLGDTLYIIPQYPQKHSFENTVESYIANKQNVKILDRSLPDHMCYLPFPSTVRIGRDIFIDCSRENEFAYKHFESFADELSKHHRVHITHTGDHNDGIFCPVAAGKIISTHYREQYHETFPGWNVFFLPDTSKSNGNNNNWWVPGKDYACYNEKVVQHAKNWIGNFKETVFEVNMLVIDQSNVLCLSEDDSVCRHLESIGITPHVVEFRTRGFWDGGLHCLTLDIYREGQSVDYWPDRGNNQKYYY
jgi:hypothetical protein